MAERKKLKKRKELYENTVSEKPTKNEYAVAKYLKQNLPVKKTKFLNHIVEYFVAFKAVDVLMESPWARDLKRYEYIFPDRITIIKFLDIMLQHKFFHRAKKIPINPKDLSLRSLKKLKDEEKKVSKTKNAKNKNDSEGDTLKEKKELNGQKEEKLEEKRSADETRKLKRRVRLDMHLEQLFVDGNEIYVWIYDPIPFYYWIAGFFLVFAAIAVCLYPLWPPIFRKNIQYLCFAAAGVLILILNLALIRLVLFCLLWLVTLGRHHLWILPNLTADVGFFASFWPLYEYKYVSTKKSKKESSDPDESDERDQSEADDEREPSDSESTVNN